jgi:mono/diheme cytochrome c family protein
MINNRLWLGLLVSATSAYAEPFPQADQTHGQKLHQQHCQACHSRRFGGDGSEMYLRLDRKVHSIAALEQQLTRCTTQLKLEWFPDDERDVAAYLNHRFYQLSR